MHLQVLKMHRVTNIDHRQCKCLWGMLRACLVAFQPIAVLIGWNEGSQVCNSQVSPADKTVLALRCGLETGCGLYEVVTACSFFESPVVQFCHDSLCGSLPTDRPAYVLDHESAVCLHMASRYHMVVCAFRM